MKKQSSIRATVPALLTVIIASTQFANAINRNDILSDLETLHHNLEVSNFDLYAHTSKQAFADGLTQAAEKARDGMTEIDAFRLLQPVVAQAKQSHCSISIPFQSSYGSYIGAGGTVFPLDLRIEDGQLIVSHDYATPNDSPLIGKKVASINAQSGADIIAGIQHFFSGDSQAFLYSFLELLAFPRCYWLMYGGPDTFAVTFSDGSAIELEPMPAGTFESLKSQERTLQNTTRASKLFSSTGYYRPGIFLNQDSGQDLADHNTFANGEFLQFFEQAKTLFRENHCDSLILDLRGNPGGDNSFSDPVIAWFATRPFSFCSRFEVRTSEITKSFWKDLDTPGLESLKKAILEHPNGERFEVGIEEKLPDPDDLRFKGNVYVLIDRFSYSNAVSVAAVVKDYDFGTLVGETTTDTPSAFGAAQSFKLPKTGLTVMFPKAFITRPGGDRTMQGVQPDHPVIDDLSTPEDEVINFVLELIQKEKHGS